MRWQRLTGADRSAATRHHATVRSAVRQYIGQDALSCQAAFPSVRNYLSSFLVGVKLFFHFPDRLCQVLVDGGFTDAGLFCNGFIGQSLVKAQAEDSAGL